MAFCFFFKILIVTSFQHLLLFYLSYWSSLANRCCKITVKRKTEERVLVLKCHQTASRAKLLFQPDISSIYLEYISRMVKQQLLCDFTVWFRGKILLILDPWLWLCKMAAGEVALNSLNLLHFVLRCRLCQLEIDPHYRESSAESLKFGRGLDSE